MPEQAFIQEYQSNAQLQRDLANRSLGNNNWKGIVDAAAHVASDDRKFAIVHCVLATIFDTLDGAQEGNPMVGVTFPAGFVIYGAFTTLKLASGAVIAYYDKPLMTP